MTINRNDTECFTVSNPTELYCLNNFRDILQCNASLLLWNTRYLMRRFTCVISIIKINVFWESLLNYSQTSNWTLTVGNSWVAWWTDFCSSSQLVHPNEMLNGPNNTAFHKLVRFASRWNTVRMNQTPWSSHSKYRKAFLPMRRTLKSNREIFHFNYITFKWFKWWSTQNNPIYIEWPMARNFSFHF